MEHESESSSVEKTTTLAKKRRAHYKSRKGCKECKQRHVKCDEQRPICLQCSTLERPCSYAYLNPDHQTTSDGASPMSVPAGSPPQLQSQSPSQPQPQSPSQSQSQSQSYFAQSQTSFPSSPQESATQQQPLQVFNLGHLALLHHVETDMLKPPHTPFVADEKDARPLLDMILKAAFSTPFFMDELLAFAALHLGMLDSDIVKKDHYHHQAVHLQTRALAIFNATNCDITEQNCTAYFLFSSFIGMHMLYDTVTNQTNSPELLEGFIQFVGLYRGVGIVSSRSWHVIRNSELNSIFSLIEAVERLNVPSEDCCDRLLNLLLSAEERLGSSSYEACYDAVQILQWIFNQYAVLPEPTNGHIILAWPVRLPIKYLELLQSRQPEALVIMAYWAVLLHRGRNYWVFGQGGWLLIEAIFGFLGPSWDEWLAWPRQSLMLTR